MKMVKSFLIQLFRGVHYLILVFSFSALTWLVFLLCIKQNFFGFRVEAPASVLYLIIFYLFAWWLIKFESIPLKFWETKKEHFYILLIKISDFVIFAIEVIISIVMFSNVEELGIWLILVSFFLFLVLEKLKLKLKKLLKIESTTSSALPQGD